MPNVFYRCSKSNIPDIIVNFSHKEYKRLQEIRESRKNLNDNVDKYELEARHTGLSINLNYETRDKLKALAKELEMPMAQLCRRLIIDLISTFEGEKNDGDSSND